MHHFQTYNQHFGTFIEISLLHFSEIVLMTNIKDQLCYKTIFSQNVSSETRAKNFFGS